MKLRFVSRRPEAEGVYTFRFALNEPVQWVAGQSIRLELPAGWSVHERRFTISSAPYQQDICITTKLSSSEFKQALAALQPGTEVNAYSIEGGFVWPDTSRQLVLCASGVGITPYYSMLKQRRHQGQPLAATLLYANRSALLFEQELLAMRAAHPELHLVLLPGQRLTGERIVPYSTKDSLVYLSGPSAMVDQVGADLVAAGVPEDTLRRDWFTGRAGWELA